MVRADGRSEGQLRPVKIITDFTKYAEGSVLIQMGDTHVLCNATVEAGAPPYVPMGTGWVTAEYSMLPRATGKRTPRDVSRLKIAPRSSEIQRLIGRSLRSVVDLAKLGEYTITVDCDVLQADGGTRCASITGGFVAMALACKRMVEQGLIQENPITGWAAAVSVGIVDGVCVLDLNYREDSNAEVDFNAIMTENGDLIEVQGTGEERPFTRAEHTKLLNLGTKGVKSLIGKQKKALGGIL
ncbi:MAG: ribonuclease PH [Ruminococcaceae bacterium]|nr:ribonuclease PH [Oscillospiraceae bacterium]